MYSLNVESGAPSRTPFADDNPAATLASPFPSSDKADRRISMPYGSKELQRARNIAASRIQAVFRGNAARAELAKKYQAVTPYPSKGAYLLATNGIARRAGNTDDSPTWEDEWEVYRSAGNIRKSSGQCAYLHSLRRPKDLVKEMLMRGDAMVNANSPLDAGPIYRPGDGHNMVTNAAWLMGVAHNNATLVLTTPLDDQSILRRSKLLRSQAGNFHASALVREVAGVLKDGKFRVERDQRGKAVLIPTAKGKTSTLASYMTSGILSEQKLAAFLNTHGLKIESATQQENLHRASRVLEAPVLQASVLQASKKAGLPLNELYPIVINHLQNADIEKSLKLLDTIFNALPEDEAVDCLQSLCVELGSVTNQEDMLHILQFLDKHYNALDRAGVLQEEDNMMFDQALQSSMRQMIPYIQKAFAGPEKEALIDAAINLGGKRAEHLLAAVERIQRRKADCWSDVVFLASGLNYFEAEDRKKAWDMISAFLEQSDSLDDDDSNCARLEALYELGLMLTPSDIEAMSIPERFEIALERIGKDRADAAVGFLIDTLGTRSPVMFQRLLQMLGDYIPQIQSESDRAQSVWNLVVQIKECGTPRHGDRREALMVAARCIGIGPDFLNDPELKDAQLELKIRGEADERGADVGEDDYGSEYNQKN